MKFCSKLPTSWKVNQSNVETSTFNLSVPNLPRGKTFEIRTFPPHGMAKFVVRVLRIDQSLAGNRVNLLVFPRELTRDRKQTAWYRTYRLLRRIPEADSGCSVPFLESSYSRSCGKFALTIYTSNAHAKVK